MPKKNYQNTIIYKIYCKDESITEIYIGHTTNFKHRKNAHISNCNNEKSKEYNLKLYIYIRNNGGFDNFNIIELEKYPCNNDKEALLREGYWVKELNSSLNIQLPSRTEKEWRQENKQIINENAKKYREENKQIIKEKRKIYREENKQIIKEKGKEIIKCECGCQIRKDSLLRHKKTKKHQKLMSLLILEYDNYRY